jgi:RNA polymerase sigma-70 factor (sigma-E family)
VADHGEFTAFAAASAAPLKRAAFLLTGDSQLAEDLVQATLLRLFERWGRASIADSPLAYARTTMYSIFVSWARRRRLREIPRAVLPEQSVAGPEHAAGTTAALLAALRELPPRQRAVVVLRYYEELNATEIAGILGCTATTVRTQLSRALDKLRRDERTSALREAEWT